MGKIIKMKDLLKKEGIELGKVYTDKTMPPFKVEEEKINELGGFSHNVDFNITGNYDVHPNRDEKKKPIEHLQGFSSPEAKKVIDGALKNWAKDLRKVQHRVIKDWMSAAKSGRIDYFDLVRGLKTGDIKRAHPYETTFLTSLLSRDKIIDRFRSYFKGKKGKSGRTK